MSSVMEVAFPLLSLLILNDYLFWPREISHSILLVAAAAALVWLNRLFFRHRDKRLRGYAAVFGWAFALAQVAGARLDAAGTIAEAGQSLLSFAQLFLSSVMLAPSAGGLFVGLTEWIRRQDQPSARPRLSEKQVFWFSLGVILLCWLPAVLAYWPGIYSYDVEWQIDQIVNGNFVDHQPIFHTLFMGAFYLLGRWIGSCNAGIAIYCVFQMMVNAMTMAFVLRYLRHIRCPRWLLVCLVLFFCFAPFHQLLSISTTKDILFTDAVVVWAVLMVWGIGEPRVTLRKSWMAGWIACAAAAALLRTNGFVAVFAVLIGLVVFLRRNRMLFKRLVCLTLCAVVLNTGVHEGLMAALDAKDGPFQEMLSVPVQQIARVNHILKYESRDEIRSWLPRVHLYQPALTDYVRTTANVDPSTLPEFLAFWAKLGMKFPVIYLDAIGFLTKGYWYLNDMSHATFRGELLRYHEGYLGTIFRTSHGVTQQSLWPELYDWYEQMYSVNEYLNVPFLSVITGPALWCWLMIAVFLISVYLHRPETALPLLMCLALFACLLIGPCCIIRYVYPFVFIVPLSIGILISSPKNN